MSEKFEPTPVKKFVAILGSNPAMIDKVANDLESNQGLIDLRSSLYPFSHTDYYAVEMGAPLFRQFISFEALANPATLPDLKTLAARLEEEYSTEGKRQVNLDPGYLDYNKVVLASYKYGGQKIYLKDGVYADIVLLYNKGVFDSFVWTFPDFSTGQYNDFLLRLRRRYKQQQREALIKEDTR
jgi:hypothetical protein